MRPLEILIGVAGLALPWILFGGLIMMELLGVEMPPTSPHPQPFSTHLLDARVGSNESLLRLACVFQRPGTLEKRALWVTLLLLANYAVMPFYFRWYLMPEATKR